MDITRVLFAVLGISALVVSTNCDPMAGESRSLSARTSVVNGTTTRPSTTDAGAPAAGDAAWGAAAPEAGVVAPPAGSYEAMCLHYCETLEQTILYACLGRGADDCAATSAGVTARCLDDRCAPRLVEPSLCVSQCDALESLQSTDCEQTGAGSACAAPAAEADTCRQGCTVTTQ